MKTKVDFAKAMLQQARIGATRAPNGELREYAVQEERRWEKELEQLKFSMQPSDTPEPAAPDAA